MKDTREYLMPDYYQHFSCKMGVCRHACCEDWPITVSMEDYFRLLGVDCSPELRRRLDCAMRLKEHPTREAYAQINLRYDGKCPLRMEDGRCLLHAELGEDSLCQVCRLYPRGIHADRTPECSCANSCEAVLELLFARDEPVAFVRAPMAAEAPQAHRQIGRYETLGREQDIRLWLIRCLQQRQMPLSSRIAMLGHSLQTLEKELEHRDREALDALLETLPNPLQPEKCDVGKGLQIMEKLVRQMDQRSRSLHDYGERALAYFSEDPQQKYAAACERLMQRYPRWEICFEHALVNHLFFSGFPFRENRLTIQEAYAALCVVYALMRFVALGDAAMQEDENALADALAAVFRLVDHTPFYRYAAWMMDHLEGVTIKEAQAVIWL